MFVNIWAYADFITTVAVLFLVEKTETRFPFPREWSAVDISSKEESGATMN